jgi:arylsulfatase A-like enzyme
VPQGEASEAPARKGRGPKRAEAPAFVPDPARPVPEGKPNVLLIVWDTVRADHLTPYGYARDTTPELAKLAAEGRVWTRAVSPGMWTVPSHASLFTGLPESAHGTTAAHQWLDDRFPTLAETLSDAGWATYLFAANPHVGDHVNLGQGFERREAPDDEAWRRKATQATTSKLLPSDASNTMGPAYKPGKYAAGRDGDRTKDAGPVAAEAMFSWLDGRPQDGRPFFATLNYMEAHVPRVPSLAARKALFTDAEVAEQLAFDQSYGNLLAYTVGLMEFTPEQQGWIRDVYDASLRDLDASLVPILDGLRARGVLEDTVIIVTADHGEHLGEHHLADHKFSVFNDLIRVPLIVRYPKGVPVGVDASEVSTLDVFATVAALTQTSLPAGTLSQSLLIPRDAGAAFAELVAPTTLVFDRMRKVHPDFDSTPYEHVYASVEDEGWKCIVRGDGARSLFDLRADPGETRDLSASDPARADALCGMINTWKASFPAYQPDASAPGSNRTMTKAERCRLVQLGYAAEDPSDPCGGGR